ncbi:hypothetical protein F5141DRAFT_1066838 [Pisolithus sp. B1]|nr:hypothetical protein F5141DRAFT_1066838 [Pisolithus sp. B1]
MARDSSMKQLTSSPESDTIQLPSPKVMNASPQMRLATKKNKLQFILPLSSELSSEKELGSDPPRDELNATSSKASTDRQQPSVEIHIKQSMHTQLTPSLPQEKRLSNMPSHHDELLNLPSQEPLHNEEMQFQQPSHQVQEDQQSSRTLMSHTRSLLSLKCNCNSLNHISVLANQLPAIQYWVHHTLNTTLVNVPVAQNQWGMQLLYMKQAWNCNKMNFLTCESLQEQPEVMVSLPVAGAMESGGGVRTIHHNLPPYLPIQHPHLQSRQPRPRPVWGVGQNDDPDIVFNLHQRIYPGTSKAESTIPSSAASVRLLAVKEGYVGISPGERGMEPEPPAEIISSRMYSRDDQFSYDGIPYHPSMNPGWYDPSHRGSEVHYGPYHLQFILPPPFTVHHYPAHGYANDPTIHWPPSAKGFRCHTNVPPPFHGVHKTKYANVSGSCELPVRAYRQTQVYDSPSDASTLLGTQGGLKHSAGTRQDAVLDSTDPPAGSNIASTRDM